MAHRWEKDPEPYVHKAPCHFKTSALWICALCGQRTLTDPGCTPHPVYDGVGECSFMAEMVVRSVLEG